MRILFAATTVAMLVVPAYAQDMSGGAGRHARGGGRAANAQAQQEKKKKAEELEKASKAAVEKLPDQKYDPWRNAR